MSRHVALLRGVNVGGKNKLPMKELLRLFEEAGCSDVQTYIQSGNVTFSASPALAKRIPKLIGGALEDELGIRSPVVIRTAAQFRKVAAEHPFAGDSDDPKRLSVAFLADRPKPSAVAPLEALRAPSEQLVLRGSELFLHFPRGITKTKLSNAAIDRHLATVSTVRNWNTVQALLDRLG